MSESHPGSAPDRLYKALLRIADLMVEHRPSLNTLETADREHIIRVLRETRGVLSGPQGAAARLGLPRTTLQSKMQRLRISHKDYEA